MAINVFEGARRIAILVSVLAVIATIVGTALNEPYLTAKYSISAQGSPRERTEEFCASPAASKYFTERTLNGRAVYVTLCFKAMNFGENRDPLVPYKVDDEGMVWGAGAYTSDVMSYTDSVERDFSFSPSEEAWVESEVARLKREQWAVSLGALAVGLAIFWALVWVVGWIVRGFAGIERGTDSRP